MTLTLLDGSVSVFDDPNPNVNLAAALAANVAGATMRIGRGWYMNLVETTIPDDCQIIGSDSVIQLADLAFWHPRDNNRFAGLVIAGTNSLLVPDANAANVVVEDCLLNCASDSIINSNPALVGDITYNRCRCITMPLQGANDFSVWLGAFTGEFNDCLLEHYASGSGALDAMGFDCSAAAQVVLNDCYVLVSPQNAIAIRMAGLAVSGAGTLLTMNGGTLERFDPNGFDPCNGARATLGAVITLNGVTQIDDGGSGVPFLSTATGGMINNNP